MGKCEKWTIAYRKREEGQYLYENRSAPFQKIPNTWRYWRADPFLIEYEAKTYVFAELYDRVKHKGILGFCEFGETKPGKWRVVIEEPFHLSYPFVFQHKETLYMIPEAFQSGKILLYRARKFPDCWERVKDLAEIAAVDSTIIDTEDGRFLITFRVVDRQAELALLRMDDDMNLRDMRIVSGKEPPDARPAGKVFVANECLIRPTQDCAEGYGAALNFCHVLQLDTSAFSEKIVHKIRPEDISIKGVRRVDGIHTYNFTDQYEVIDYKQYELGIVGKLSRIWKMLTGIGR